MKPKATATPATPPAGRPAPQPGIMTMVNGRRIPQDQILKMLPGMRPVAPPESSTVKPSEASRAISRRQMTEQALARREQWEKLPLVAKDILKRAKRTMTPAEKSVLADDMIDLVRSVAKLAL